jgi:Na+:H+ antiporter, NhaA family
MVVHRLDRLVDENYDHVLGPADAQITLVEYGSYACPYCRAANEQIAAVRDQFGERLRYAFRHRPLTNNDLARRAAELIERAGPDQFWKGHLKLMSRSETLNEGDLETVAEDLGLLLKSTEAHADAIMRARERVDADERSARASGVKLTPTFFINGSRYDGPWDASSLSDAMLGTLGHRVRTAALNFARWGPSAGVLLLFATVLAIIITNSPLGPAFEAFWELDLGFILGGSTSFHLPLRDWVNDALLTIFFLVVGLEIKREFTVGHLASRQSAALPVAGAVGGMVAPAALYLLIIPTGSWSHGWGVPMATDAAFAVAVIALLGPRVPVELRIFLTAAAIVDDIGAIVVVAAFYSSELHLGFLGAAVALAVGLGLLNYSRIYRVSPYVLLGVLLWACIQASGLHATLAGIILAIFIPTRPPPNLRALTIQADAIIAAEARQSGEFLRHGPSVPTLQALDAIHDRLQSPADRLLRHAGARSSYLVLPIFALANAGVAMLPEMISGRQILMLAIIVALTLGKPLGLLGASAIAVRLGIATKPVAYTWRQLAGAGALAGIGFTMSLFIAGQAFPVAFDFAASKIAVFIASLLAAAIGTALLWNARTPSASEESRADTTSSDPVLGTALHELRYQRRPAS